MSISAPIFACADDTYAMPMPQFKLGESVPLVTSPMRSPSEHGVVRPRRRTFLLHPERYQLFARPEFFCLQQRIATDEIWFG